MEKQSSGCGVKVNDLYNSRCNLQCGSKPFDKAIQNSFGKPTEAELNKFLSDVRTGGKENIRQLYPDVNSRLRILRGDQAHRNLHIFTISYF